FMISYRCPVFQAVSKEKKPSPGLTRRLMKRWSCSTMLLRYLTCLSSTDSGSVPLALSWTTALGEAAFLSTLMTRGADRVGVIGRRSWLGHLLFSRTRLRN